MVSYQIYLYLATDVTLYALTLLSHDITPKYDSSIDINKTLLFTTLFQDLMETVTNAWQTFMCTSTQKQITINWC